MERESSRTKRAYVCPTVIMENTMGTGRVAMLLGITVKTSQRWERAGRLVPAAPTASNRRRYAESRTRAFPRLAPHRVLADFRISRAALESGHAAGAPDQD